MAQTQIYKKSFSGSIGAGMKSLVGSEGRRFYVLEHKVSSRYHKAGETQRIIVDQIELGRDSHCQVRFDESFETVSRRHAAIVKDGDNWKLVQLSQTNSTFLNGHKIEKEWYLQSGDEIQLSTNGPKLGFIVPQGDKSLVKSIGLTARMNLFRQQALRPYKTAIAVLAAMFVIGAGFGLYSHIDHKRQIEKYKAELIEQRNAAEARWQKYLQDSIKRVEEITTLKKNLVTVQKKLDAVPRVGGVVDNKAIEACMPGVYFILSSHFDVVLPDGSSGQLSCGEDGVQGWSGTGFLLDNGKFVTARHVIEPWQFWLDGSGANEFMEKLNLVANNGGKVTAHMLAISSSGAKLKLSSNQFHIDRSGDRYDSDENGVKCSLAGSDDRDFAYVSVGTSDHGLPFNVEKSKSLEMGAKLTVLGFPFGYGASAKGIKPLYGSAVVASPGLTEGMILTTDTNYEHGNSGGPVFYTDAQGKLVVVGIVSAGRGRNTGFVVPISKIQ